MGSLLVAATAIFMGLAHGQEAKDEISLVSGFDSAKTRSVFLSYSHFTDSLLRWDIGVGSSRNQDQSEEVTSRSFNLGVSTNPFHNWSIGAHLEVWGLKDELRESQIFIPYQYNLPNWDFKAGLRVGMLNFQNITGFTEDQKVSSNAIEVGARFFGFDPWSFSLDVARHRYGEDLTAFNNERFARFFSENTLALVSSLARSRSRLAVSYAWEAVDIGGAVGRSQSAIDESITGFVELTGSWDVNSEWFLSLTLGSAKVTDYGSVPQAFRDDERFGYGHLSGVYRF